MPPPLMEDTAIPYELPETKDHSFFFIDQRVETGIEAKLHRHDAWELYYVVHGYGNRMAGDTLQAFSAGDAVLIPPGMLHRWIYAPDSADDDGRVRYLMAAFSHSLVERCMEVFPEVRNRLAGVVFPTDALKFGSESSRIIRKTLAGMNDLDELGRLCEMFRAAALHLHFVRPHFCRQPHAHRAGRAAYAADMRLCDGTLRPRDLPGRDRRGNRYEPVCVLRVFPAMQGNDFLAVCHPVPAEYGLRTVEAFAETGVGDMLYGRFQ